LGSWLLPNGHQRRGAAACFSGTGVEVVEWLTTFADVVAPAGMSLESSGLSSFVAGLTAGFVSVEGVRDGTVVGAAAPGGILFGMGVLLNSTGWVGVTVAGSGSWVRGTPGAGLLGGAVFVGMAGTGLRPGGVIGGIIPAFGGIIPAPGGIIPAPGGIIMPMPPFWGIIPVPGPIMALPAIIPGGAPIIIPPPG
jgi:hypothetical protein